MQRIIESFERQTMMQTLGAELTVSVQDMWKSQRQSYPVVSNNMAMPMLL